MALLCLLVLLLAAAARALEVPALTGRVVDRAEVISNQAEAELNARLAAFERQTGHQVAVLTVPSLEGDPIEDFSIRVVENWKLGRAGHDDGVLILVVPKDRKLRIEVGYGLEGVLPDAIASRIVREVMVPRLRLGDTEGAILAGVDAVLRATGGGGAGGDSAARHKQPGWLGQLLSLGLAGLLLFFLITMFPLFLLMRLLSGGPGRRSTRSFVHFGSGGGGLWGDGSWGGGGGFSGGGGGFGGGGASGGW